MVGGGRLVQEFGGRRRRLGGGFRLGVGVKSLVGSASAWSVKGGFLLLPATRERKKKSSLFSGTGEQKRLLSTTFVFYCRYLVSLSWISASTFIPLLLSISSSPLSSTSALAWWVCVCIRIATRPRYDVGWV